MSEREALLSWLSAELDVCVAARPKTAAGYWRKRYERALRALRYIADQHDHASPCRTIRFISREVQREQP